MNSKANLFEFSSYKFDIHTREAHFTYTLHFEDGSTDSFTEKLILPEKEMAKNIPLDLLNDILSAMHLMFGINYWKLYCPAKITIHTRPLTEKQAQFWNTVYTKGLGEFFYRNQIDFRGLINFPYEIPNQVRDDVNLQPISFPLEKRALTGIAGGKDSIVTAELLKKNNIPVAGFVIDTQKEQTIIDEVIQVMGIEKIAIKRMLDPKLFEYNQKEGTYNGHVPVVAQFSFIALLAAILYDYRYIVMSSERSASFGNIQWQGEEMNHQWSKSLEFELMFKLYVKTYITSDVEYFSLLRPLTELKIVETFIQYPQYFSVFASCNKNFKVHEKSLVGKRWCGECPKCAFVFIMLTAFLPKEKVVEIFGKNMLAEESLVSMYRDLVGLTDLKPWECVGTFDESKVALYMIYEKGEFKESPVIKMFEKEVVPGMQNIEALKKEVLEIGDISSLPEEFLNVIPVPYRSTG